MPNHDIPEKAADLLPNDGAAPQQIPMPGGKILDIGPAEVGRRLPAAVVSGTGGGPEPAPERGGEVFPPPPRPPFEGLPAWFKMLVVIVSLASATTSISFANYTMRDALSVSNFTDSDVNTLADISRLAANNRQSSGNPEFVAHVFDVAAQSKLISNHQARALIGIATGVALFAIGFALFLIGVDGAFQVQMQNNAGPALSVTAAAPGILCFILGAGMIYGAMLRGHDLKIPPFDASSYISTTVERVAPSDTLDIRGAKAK